MIPQWVLRHGIPWSFPPCARIGRDQFATISMLGSDSGVGIADSAANVGVALALASCRGEPFDVPDGACCGLNGQTISVRLATTIPSETAATYCIRNTDPDLPTKGGGS